MTTLPSTLTALIDRLDSQAVIQAGVLSWASPIASFGDVAIAEVATVGLNPSNREFLDEDGDELDGSSRRFHTLSSLGLRSWSEADARHLGQMIDAFCSYFECNPYNRWFRVLEPLLSSIGASYYGTHPRVACHLDLIPFATGRKWTDLSQGQRTTLSDLAGNALGLLIRDSSIRLLILNGQGVVERFAEQADKPLRREQRPDWALPRSSSKAVLGAAYHGFVEELAGVDLGREILVLGYNHNLQSSFGVSAAVVREVQRWIGESASGVLTDVPNRR